MLVLIIPYCNVLEYGQNRFYRQSEPSSNQTPTHWGQNWFLFTNKGKCKSLAKRVSISAFLCWQTRSENITVTVVQKQVFHQGTPAKASSVAICASYCPHPLLKMGKHLYSNRTSHAKRLLLLRFAHIFHSGCCLLTKNATCCCSLCVIPMALFILNFIYCCCTVVYGQYFSILCDKFW